MLVNISVYQKNDVWYASIIENDRLKRIKIDGSLIQLLKQQGHKNYYECRISGCETSNNISGSSDKELCSDSTS